MEKEIKNFKRKELFEMYHSRTNPFAFVTTKVDITKLYKLGKKYGTQYGVIAYYITKVVNEIDGFKMRYIDGEFMYYDEIKPKFTDMIDEDLIGFFGSKYTLDLDKFIEDYKKCKESFKERRESDSDNSEDVIWLSCQPWYSFTGITPPFDKSITIPQFNWDKFEITEDKVTMNLLIVVHHGFVDGFQIGKFINRLQKEINEIDV